MAEPARRAPAPRDSELSSDDPYRYGWGVRRVRLPDGRVEVREVPLTPEDFLDPQVGDQLTQNSFHIDFVSDLRDMLYRRYESHPDVLVTSDLKMLWGIPGLRNPSPDVAVIPGVRDKKAFRRSFAVRKEGTRPCLVVEVVSDDPVIRSKDHNEKVAIYERAGIQEYLILDPPFATRNGCFQMTARRLDAKGRYRLAEPHDPEGFLSRTTGLWFRLTPDHREVYVVDTETGKRLESSSELAARAAQAEARAAQADARAAQADARAAHEAEARREAEAENARLREAFARLQKSGKAD